eukprot:8749708-Ditylum_brightwellii.AAC.1
MRKSPSSSPFPKKLRSNMFKVIIQIGSLIYIIGSVAIFCKQRSTNQSIDSVEVGFASNQNQHLKNRASAVGGFHPPAGDANDNYQKKVRKKAKATVQQQHGSVEIHQINTNKRHNDYVDAINNYETNNAGKTKSET